MKKLFFIIPVFFICYIILLYKPSTIKHSKHIQINPGMSFFEIGKSLKEEKLINSTVVFNLYVIFNGSWNSLEAGKYDIPPSLNIKETVSYLQHGSFDIKLTFIEGWRKEEMAEYIDSVKDLKMTGKQFLIETKHLEGYLFPSTYIVPSSIKAKKLVNIMHKTFKEKIKLLDKNRSKLSEKQIVIFASIVEKEVRTDISRAILAGILIKRWKNNWRLGVDVSIQYAVGNDRDWWPNSLTKQDLSIKSPYNTRKNKGLPPTPICNPSFSSLNAVVNYKESPYWFYISDTDGNIHFSCTYEEHKENIKKYLGG